LSRERLALGAAPAGARVAAHGADAVQAELLARARAEGERAGRAAAGEWLDQAAERVAAQEAEARAALARTASELALEIARTLLRREVGRGQYELETMVRETLAEAATGRSPCVVHLNPVDHARLADVRFRSGTRLESDEGVARGDVHVETSLGLLVRDLDGALDSIAKRLREELA
jgi:flagellar biosynthesis/type III secretory pathway protein FliH